MSGEVKILQHGAVLEVVIDRPKANAINLDVSRELGRVFCHFRDTEGLRAAIITGAGNGFFCAGWDIGTDEDTNPGFDADYGVGGIAGLTGLFDIHKPIVAAVNGYCVGAGLELVLGCDVIVASGNATFMLPEVNIGIPPEPSSIQRLLNRIPRSIAYEMLYTSARMSAERMLDVGLLNYVVSQDELLPLARNMAAAMAGAAPLALTACKSAANAVSHLSAEAAFQMRTEGKLPGHIAAWNSEDSFEGGRAFVAKRKPVWTGR